MSNTETVNREHKDRLFISLFGSAERKENTLELYNAVNGSHYDNPDDITIYTIEDALYMTMKNDVAFLISCHMNLYEHQSTPNPNMPVRGLLYLAKLYDKYIETQELNIYGRERMKLPTPRFVVFYNGTEERPEKEILRLTDLFEKKEESCVEVTATVFNVNAGKNDALMEQSKTLREYAQLVALIREKRKRMPLKEAADEAVTECIKAGILTDYLLARKAEVYDMLLTEYDEEKVHRMFFRDGERKGREEGASLSIIRQVQRKLAKGCDAEQIADALEEKPEAIEEIIAAIREAGEGADAESVYRLMTVRQRA